MKVFKHKNIEYTEVNISELYDERIDSEYYQAEYIENALTIERKGTKEVKDFMSRPQYGLSLAMNEQKEGYKILKMDDIIGVLANDERAKYADIDSSIFQNYQLNKFDVLFNRVNSDEFVGRTGIYLLDGEHTFASYLVRVTSEYSYQNCYLTIFLNSKYGYKSLQRVKRRAVNQANINAQELKSLKIPIPTISFQQTIERLVLESYEQKQQAEALYKEAEKLLLQEIGLFNWQPKKRVYHLNKVAFEKEDTIGEATLSQIISNDRIDSEYYNDNNVTIENIIKTYQNGYGKLGNICQINKYLYSPKETTSYKYIELSNVERLGNISNVEEIEGDKLPSRARRLVTKGDIVMSSVEGSLNKCAIITDEFDESVCSTGFHLLTSNQINSEVLLILFKSKPYQRLLKKGCSGTILTAINETFLNAILLPIINDKVQVIVTEKVQKLNHALSKSKQLLETAKRAVEIYIEKDENEAITYINK